VIFWTERETEGENGEVEKIPFMRYYTVFNFAQCENLPEEKFALPENQNHNHDPVDAAEKIISGMPLRPETKTGNRACYSPTMDVVTMPAKESFAKIENFYSVSFHELVHSTGHESRLGRYKDKNYKDAAFGTADYSREELVAEMGAAFLNHEAGIFATTETMNAGYISGWLSKLKADSKAVVLAAGKAQKAADYILNRAAPKV
jgi:antirestriction protein ArdC